MSVTPMRVVILRGTFAGISNALEIGWLTKGDQKAAVHLINNEHYIVFQPSCQSSYPATSPRIF